uniref:Uncharacterized protein n=1 Tax=Cacopsylla melanoneura TaxID=428564 RepID=A0A8D9FJ04_9HEMI
MANSKCQWQTAVSMAMRMIWKSGLYKIVHNSPPLFYICSTYFHGNVAWVNGVEFAKVFLPHLLLFLFPCHFTPNKSLFTSNKSLFTSNTQRPLTPGIHPPNVKFQNVTATPFPCR